MQNVTMHVEDAYGTSICEGLPESEAVDVAQNWANRLGKKVYLYCDQDDETGPVCIAPEETISDSERSAAAADYRYDEQRDWEQVHSK